MKPDYVTWTENGKEYKQVSAPWKRHLLATYADAFLLNTFVETGTCEGDTLETLHNKFDKSISIEKDNERYWKAYERFKDYKGVLLIHGDSGVELPKLLKALPDGVLFWLDAHGSDWIGPIVKEMQAIFDSGIKGVILVDDVDYMPDVLPTHPDWPPTTEYGITRLVHVG